MFIRARRYAPTDTTYYQACESYRDEHGRPRQRVICSLSAERLSLQIAAAKAWRWRPDAIAKLERVLAAVGDWTPPGWTAEQEERLIRDIKEAPVKRADDGGHARIAAAERISVIYAMRLGRRALSGPLAQMRRVSGDRGHFPKSYPSRYPFSAASPQRFVLSCIFRVWYLLPHRLVVGEHLLDGRADRQRREFVDRAVEEIPAVRDDRRTGCVVRTCRRASGEQARRDREDGEWQPEVGHVAHVGPDLNIPQNPNRISDFAGVASAHPQSGFSQDLAGHENAGVRSGSAQRSRDRSDHPLSGAHGGRKKT